MADYLGTITGNGDSGGGSSNSSSFDLSKVLNVDNNSSFEQTNYSNHQSSSQDHSVTDNGSEQSQSYEATSGGSGHDGSSTSYASHDQDFGGSSSDASDASHNVDYSSHQFTNEFSLDSSLDALNQSQHHDGGLLGAA